MPSFITGYEMLDGSRWSGPDIDAADFAEAEKIAAGMRGNGGEVLHVDGLLIERIPIAAESDGEGLLIAHGIAAADPHFGGRSVLA